MEDNDFKYIIQDFSYVYVGAKATYGELEENEDVPHKLKEVIHRIILQEVAPETTPENHVFYLTADSASYKAYKKMKARFKISVWESPERKKKGPLGMGRTKKAGYVNREYGLDEIVGNQALFQKKDTAIVEEVRISKLGLASIIV